MLSDLDLHKCTGFQRSDREGRLQRKAAEGGVREQGNWCKDWTFLKARQRFPPSFMSFCKNWNLGNQCKIADILVTVLSVINKFNFTFDKS